MIRSLLISVLLLCAVTPFAFAKEAQPTGDDPAVEQRLHKLSKELRCLVCQNETLADSRADLALDLRREIREQMRAGKSDEQIAAFLTERYGDFVLYRPPLKPSTYPLWFGPFVLLASGLFALYRSLKQRRPLPDVEPMSAKERRRIRQLLGLRHEEDPA